MKAANVRYYWWWSLVVFAGIVLGLIICGAVIGPREHSIRDGISYFEAVEQDRPGENNILLAVVLAIGAFAGFVFLCARLRVGFQSVTNHKKTPQASVPGSSSPEI
jgi:hypothetical protein